MKARKSLNTSVFSGSHEVNGMTGADNTASVCETLVSRDFTSSFRGFSAIDRYLGRDSLPFVVVETNADPADLVRLFEDLRFPGSALADGAVEREQHYFFYCVDSDTPDRNERRSFDLLNFSQDWKTRRFYDPLGMYPFLRELRDGSGTAETAPQFRWWEGLSPGTDYYRALTDGALILARYSRTAAEEGGAGETASVAIAEYFCSLRRKAPPREEEQRLLLTGLLVSPRPDLGLRLLKAAGFIEELWPELAALDGVDHSKEFHPEGNAWDHTLETFRYRKPAVRGVYDFRLSLGLLLHDMGKPLAEASGSRRFDGHAELGAGAARKFLERLGFDGAFIADIFYLVKNHMLPAALPRLPLVRTGEVLESPLFPVLLELYRCDESSSFKGLDGYYESSAAYQLYLRNRRNPYRSADGKKLKRVRG
ncbi:MAG: HD domain-containing protein [Treponema sp.]|jgi:poly(A) polymerase|nr:HD domain-containing protein [Treponema sp.]